LEGLTSDTWLDADGVFLISTSVHHDARSSEVEELGSRWKSSLGQGAEALSLGVTLTTGGHKTNGKNDVLEVELGGHSRVALGWDGLDGKSVGLGLGHLGSVGSELVDEVAASDHFEGTSSSSLGNSTISSGLNELKGDAWSGRTILPGWDTPWELESDEVSTFGDSTSGSWKGEVDGDGS